jgi:hypothetical protein
MLPGRSNDMHNISLIETSTFYSIDHFELTIGIFKMQLIEVLD